MTAEDLASYAPEWVNPISIDYRGWRVYELPPNGQGMAALEMLNIMETSPAVAAGASSPAEMHKRIEAMKLAYADVRRYDADPRTYDVPVAALLSKEYARKRASLIKETANCTVPAGQPIAGDTTYLTVVDKDGNMASWIQSIYSEFGSGVTVDGMGFLLHNRGGLFSLDSSSPNALAPHKRPFNTLAAAFLMQGERADWGSKKGTRRAFIAKNFRILLLLGDNFGDFVDAYKGSEQDRQKVYDSSAAHWGHDWIMLPNPSYGSFEAVPYAFDYGAAPDAMRDAKRKVLNSWDGK